MYRLYVVWNDGTRQTYEFKTREEAEEKANGLRKAFGEQVWCGIC